MELSGNRSQDEDKVMQRQLYRAGQNQAAQTSGSAPSKSSSPAAAKPKSSSGKSSSERPGLLTPGQGRKVFIGLGVAGWLLLLGSVSYCLFLPDMEKEAHDRLALFSKMRDMTSEERREKFEEFREKEKNMTPAERDQMRKLMGKEMNRKRNKDSFDFLKMSPEEQVAQLKKESEEWAKRMEERRKMRGDKGNRGNRGGGQNGGKGGGGGGGGPPGGGWGGRGGGGGDTDRPDALGKSLDSRSPESRAGGAYRAALMQKMGIGFGGRGGPGGGRGGPPTGR